MFFGGALLGGFLMSLGSQASMLLICVLSILVDCRRQKFRNLEVKWKKEKMYIYIYAYTITTRVIVSIKICLETFQTC